jgi:hypothetical protein
MLIFHLGLYDEPLLYRQPTVTILGKFDGLNNVIYVQNFIIIRKNVLFGKYLKVTYVPTGKRSRPLGYCA